MLLFRLGKYLLAGNVVETSRPFVTVEVRRRITESSSIPVTPVKVRLSEAFLINETFDVSSLEESVVPPENYLNLAHSALVPFVTCGRQALGEVTLSGYSRSKGLFIEGQDSWLPLQSLLTNVQVGQTMALEAHRDRLKSLGLLEGIDNVPVGESYVDLQRPLHVYMKTCPFRDVTTIGEGTAVGVCGYYKGCAVVEADGELFWLPVEEASFYDKDRKDDMYYFQNQDSNIDTIPDPLQSLPSKVALADAPSRPQDNWNAAPNLPKVSGHFSPIPTIRNDDYSIFGESYPGTNGYEDDERLTDPCLHDISNTPGLDPADQDEEIEDHLDDIARLMVQDDTGRSSVPHDYTGEYGDDVVAEGGAVGAPAKNLPPAAPGPRPKGSAPKTGLGYHDKEMLKAISKGKVPERLPGLSSHDTDTIFGGLKTQGYIDNNDRLTSKGRDALKESWESKLAESIIMEPGFVKTPEDEKKWDKAKAAAKKQNPDDFYALANHIFHKMKGESTASESMPDPKDISKIEKALRAKEEAVEEGLFGFKSSKEKEREKAAAIAKSREAEQAKKKEKDAIIALAAKKLASVPTDEIGLFKTPQEVGGYWFIRANDPYPSPDRVHAIRKAELYRKDNSSSWQKARKAVARGAMASTAESVKESVLNSIDSGSDMDHILGSGAFSEGFQKAYNEAAAKLFG